MAIECAYCGGRHESPREVRQCWQDGGQKDVPLDDDRGPFVSDPPIDQPDADSPRRTDVPAQRARPRSPVGASIERGVAPARPGPDALARNVVVGAGEPSPHAWSGVDRVVVDADAIAGPGAVLESMREARHARRRLVIELHVDIEREPLLMTEATPFEVGTRFAFDGDELHHLVWSNSIDHRSSGDPRWVALDRAVAAGARPTSGDEPGDIVTPTGTNVWIDGGPFRYTAPIDGVPVVHAVAIEHGSFQPPIGNECRADLAPDQLEAVAHVGGAARIIAPAGSGKTRVLTERARHLITAWRIPPSAISLVAFNKRAQQEMTERTQDLPGLDIRTLNSIALAIVNGRPPFAPQPQHWKTIDEVEVRRIIGDIVSFPRRRNSDPVAPWIEALGLIRLGLVPPDEAEIESGGDVDGLSDAWPAYRAALERRTAVDFDDQIYRALLVLLRQPAARRAAQRACRVMLVDEFQDLTPAHLLMIRLLAAPDGAVFGVGDDDQTIYGYNGADPEWLIDFAGLFPGAGAHPLEVNYRCPAGVVEIADRLLRHNRRRVPKTIRAHATTGGGWSIDRAVDPVGATSQAVAAAIESGAPPNDIAVLTRVNALLAPVQVALAADGVPISGGVGLEFADRTAIRSTLAWIRLATVGSHGSFAPADLREALRRPSRSFHPRINDWVCEQSSVVDLHRLATRLNNERDADRVTEFANDIQTLQKMVAESVPTSDLTLALTDEIGLAGAVGSLDQHRRGMNRGSQGDDLTAIRHLAALHDDVSTFESWLRRHLAVRRDAGGVTLATVHRVKGQEWPHVVVHLADAEQYPHRLAEDVEEERRLFHVAITRAARHATIVTGPTPSPFVDELTTEPESSEPVDTHRTDPPSRPSARSRRDTTDPGAELDADATARYEALKALRNSLRDGKPAYVVFDNKTLAWIARTAPTTRGEMSKIPGVGPAKLDKYGDAVIELITAHLA